MKKLLAILLLVGCGEIPCEERFDLYTMGLCVQSNGYQVNIQNLESTIQVTEDTLNRFYPDDPVDIEQVLIEQNVTLKYSDFLYFNRGVTLNSFTDEADGEHYDVRIFVLGWSCWNRNYVTAHELLHIVSHHHLGVDSEINANHSFPHMFLIWAEDNDLPEEETVEHYIFDHVVDMCTLD